MAIIAIVVEDNSNTEALNHILHEYSDAVIGRMGIPYRAKGISLISVAVDAPMNMISAMSGKIGMLEGITAKTVYQPEH